MLLNNWGHGSPISSSMIVEQHLLALIIPLNPNFPAKKRRSRVRKLLAGLEVAVQMRVI